MGGNVPDDAVGGIGRIDDAVARLGGDRGRWTETVSESDDWERDAGSVNDDTSTTKGETRRACL